MPYDPSKPYMTGEPYDSLMVNEIKRRAEMHGVTLTLTDTDVLGCLRACQDAAAHLGGAVDPVEAVWSVLRNA